MNNFENNLIVLNTEDGEELRFELLDTVEYEDKTYSVVIALPEDGSVPPDDKEPEEMYILLTERDEDGMCEYSDVEDDDTLDKVYSIFRERYGDEFKFED